MQIKTGQRRPNEFFRATFNNVSDYLTSFVEITRATGPGNETATFIAQFSSRSALSLAGSLPAAL
jgi:hypothetical protein